MSSETKDWDRNAIRENYAKDANFRAFIDKMAERQKEPNGNQTTVDYMVDEFGISRGEAVTILRTFAASGCGDFMIGRRNQKSRIEWHVSALAVAKDAKEVKTLENQQLIAQATQETGYVEQRIQLRPNAVAVIKVPIDMTRGEAERLAGVIQNIWFVAGGSI